jgi:cbb3-type cytochrome oxidase maturation protein
VESLLLLIPLSALVIVGAAAVFWWAVDDGQFEDLERQGRRSLFDDADSEPAAEPATDATRTRST